MLQEKGREEQKETWQDLVNKTEWQNNKQADTDADSSREAGCVCNPGELDTAVMIHCHILYEPTSELQQTITKTKSQIWPAPLFWVTLNPKLQFMFSAMQQSERSLLSSDIIQHVYLFKSVLFYTFK